MAEVEIIIVVRDDDGALLANAFTNGASDSGFAGTGAAADQNQMSLGADSIRGMPPRKICLELKIIKRVSCNFPLQEPISSS